MKQHNKHLYSGTEKPPKKLLSIWSRQVGTTIELYLDDTGKGLKAVWTNGRFSDVTYIPFTDLKGLLECLQQS